MKEPTIYYRVMIHNINFACGIWPYKGDSTEYLPYTKDKPKVTCKNCKKTIFYKKEIYTFDDWLKAKDW